MQEKGVKVKADKTKEVLESMRRMKRVKAAKGDEI